MKQQLLGIAAAVAVAGLISLFSARRIEAQYSSPVKVMNTTSAPAIGSIMDDHGRIPYQSNISTPVSSCSGNNTCIFQFPPVPAGHRLVIERLTGIIHASNATEMEIRVDRGIQNDGTGIKADFRLLNPSALNTAFNELLLGYYDAGEVPSVLVFLQPNNGQFFSSGAHLFLAGYMLDCAAAPCAPIAQ